MSKPVELRLFLDSNVLLGGIVAAWGLDKAVLSLCAAKIARLVLAEIVRDEIEENLSIQSYRAAMTGLRFKEGRLLAK